jgi:hypothetical protein
MQMRENLTTTERQMSRRFGIKTATKLKRNFMGEDKGGEKDFENFST